MVRISPDLSFDITRIRVFFISKIDMLHFHTHVFSVLVLLLHTSVFFYKNVIRCYLLLQQQITSDNIFFKSLRDMLHFYMYILSLFFNQCREEHEIVLLLFATLHTVSMFLLSFWQVGSLPVKTSLHYFIKYSFHGILFL